MLGLGHLALTLAGQSLIARQSSDALHDRDFGLYAAAASPASSSGRPWPGLALSSAGRPLEGATTLGFLVAPADGARRPDLARHRPARADAAATRPGRGRPLRAGS